MGEDGLTLMGLCITREKKLLSGVQKVGFTTTQSLALVVGLKRVAQSEKFPGTSLSLMRPTFGDCGGPKDWGCLDRAFESTAAF